MYAEYAYNNMICDRCYIFDARLRSKCYQFFFFFFAISNVATWSSREVQQVRSKKSKNKKNVNDSGIATYSSAAVLNIGVVTAINTP